MSELTIKETVRARDGYKCRECGLSQVEHVRKYGKVLDVHRLSPGGLYTVDGSIAVCRKCHGRLARSAYGSSGRCRVVVYPTPEVHRILRVEAASLGIKVKDLINQILEEALAAEIAEIRRYQAENGTMYPTVAVSP